MPYFLGDLKAPGELFNLTELALLLGTAELHFAKFLLKADFCFKFYEFKGIAIQGENKSKA